MCVTQINRDETQCLYWHTLFPPLPTASTHTNMNSSDSLILLLLSS